jgi:enoyl-CoA hydratase/carnithine racemase
MTESERLLSWVEEGIGWIVFNKPERRNAISDDMWLALADALERFGADEAVRIIVMRGAGEEAFVSGADISQFEKNLAGASATPAAREAFREAGARGRAALAAVQKPLIALIHGYCLGGGLMVAMQADIRMASDQAKFSIPAAKLGAAYPFEHVRRLVQLVGPAFAAEMLMSARMFDASEAKAMGLVNQILPREKLDEAVAAMARSIAQKAPLSLAASKATIRAILNDPAALGSAEYEALSQACAHSEDFLEGARAFLEKRSARFVGR